MELGWSAHGPTDKWLSREADLRSSDFSQYNAFYDKTGISLASIYGRIEDFRKTGRMTEKLKELEDLVPQAECAKH